MSRLLTHARGGGFDSQSGTGRCNRGVKVFCCDAGNWEEAIHGCHWTDWYEISTKPESKEAILTCLHSGESCSKNENEMAKSSDKCTIFHPKSE